MAETVMVANTPETVPTGNGSKDFNSLPGELHLAILETFDHPSEILLYITACPKAYRAFNESRGAVLKLFVETTLSPTAIRTGIKIHHLMSTGHTLNHQELGKYGREINTDPDSLSVEHLIALFRLCAFHERFVCGCSRQSWLEGGLFEAMWPDLGTGVKREGLIYFLKPNLAHRLWRLERPSIDHIPLHARLYSGFFSLELFLRLGGVDHSWYPTHPRRMGRSLEEVRRPWAELYDLPHPRPPPNDDWLTVDDDLGADMELVNCYLCSLKDRKDPAVWVTEVSEAEIHKMHHLEFLATRHLPATESDAL